MFAPPEALRRSNQALRLRCEEMEGWQQRTRDEREFLSCRFQEARALVERLAQENHSLKVTANGPGSSPSSGLSCSSSQTEDLQGRPAVNGPTDGQQVEMSEWTPAVCLLPEEMWFFSGLMKTWPEAETEFRFYRVKCIETGELIVLWWQVCNELKDKNNFL